MEMVVMEVIVKEIVVLEIFERIESSYQVSMACIYLNLV